MDFKERVLVVDDDFTLLEQAESILEVEYVVSLAPSGEKAIKFLESGYGVDLILLDILMPDMDGYETLEKIRKIAGYKNVPVIFLTSLSDPEAEMQSLSSGAADFINKPFNPGILLSRISLRLKAGNQLDGKKLAALEEPLTESELRVAKLLAKFYSNEEICQELNYALDSVKKLVSRVLMKLEIKNRRDIKVYFK